MTTEFISVLDAVTRYNLSQNKIRKIVKDNKGTENVKQVAIKGKHGFKYLISVNYLDTMFTPVNKAKTKQKQGKNEVKTDLEQSNQLVIQLRTENKRLNNQIENQNKVIENLSDTIKDQNKVIVAQAMQVHQLTEQTTQHQTQQNKEITNFETQHYTEQPTDHQSEATNTPSDTSKKNQGPGATSKTPSVLFAVIFALLGLIIVLLWS